MATNRPDPVEEWAPMFTRYFNDEQIIRDCISQYQLGDWCKLCDAPVPAGENGETHAKRHKRELRSWHTRRKREAERKAAQNARRAREMKARKKREEDPPFEG